MKKREIRQHYREKSREIKSRLKEFKELRDSSEERKFRELAFVILTSRTDAEKSWEAVQKLDNTGKLLEGDSEEIQEVLEQKGIQYAEEKAGYITENRKMLSQPTLKDSEKSLKISHRIDPENLESSRKWLVENVKGLGWKGASHFLRNIGHGNSFAIISTHIASQMSVLGINDNPDLPETREEYTELEEEINQLAEDVGIDIQALDLVLWSMKTGKVFR